ncbi:MAG: type II toxin-antitoxin system RelE/ParE family toxin [Methanothrix sp.]|nr:type II toxin-antitoxin system RelE/ParE family toxin [Methanothrix sp.]
MAFQTITTSYFDKKFKKLTRKDGLLRERVIRKLQAISINPEIGEPKRHALRGLRSVHVDPFVIIYTIIADVILLINFDEHDNAYDATPPILNSLLSDPRTIEALENAGITAEEYLLFVKSLRKKK